MSLFRILCRCEVSLYPDQDSGGGAVSILTSLVETLNDL